MPATRVTICLPGHLRAAVAKKADAAGQTVSDYLRSLIERDTGLSAGDMPQGFAAVSKQKRKAASRQGVKQRWGTAKK